MRGLIALLAGSIIFGAVSSSSHFKLQEYGVNNGGTNGSASSTYKAQASTGEVSGNTAAGTTKKLNPGLIQVEQSNVPPAPALDNGSGSYYNKLNIVINSGNNPSDATYSIAVSTSSNFASVSYVQNDGTLGSGQNYQTYSFWGGSSGFMIVGLATNTTYYAKVSASSGQFTTSPYGPSATATTAAQAISFSVTPNSINLGNLNAGSVVSSGTISFGFTTNAANGGNIYVSGSTSGLFSASNSHSLAIPDASDNLDSLNEGFGLQAVSASAPLSIQAPYNTSGNSVGAIYTTFAPVYSSVSVIGSGGATAKLMAKAAATTPSGSDYTNTLTFVAAASY